MALQWNMCLVYKMELVPIKLENIRLCASGVWFKNWTWWCMSEMNAQNECTRKYCDFLYIMHGSIRIIPQCIKVTLSSGALLHIQFHFGIFALSQIITKIYLQTFKRLCGKLKKSQQLHLTIFWHFLNEKQPQEKEGALSLQIILLFKPPLHLQLFFLPISCRKWHCEGYFD